MSIDVKQILNSRPHSMADVVVQKMNEFKDLKEPIPGQNTPKFANGTQLQESGQAAEYSRLSGVLARIKGYQTACENAKNRSNQEYDFLTKLQDIVEQFQCDETASKLEVGKSRTDFANDALKKIQDLLNTNIDGQYIFGGADTKTPPCAVDLTKVSNIVGGIGTANYAQHVAPNYKTIQLSDSLSASVTTGIHAREQAIIDMITALNFAKESDGAAGGQAESKLSEALQKGFKNLEHLIYKVSTNINTIEEQKDYNEKLEIETKDAFQKLSTVDDAEATSSFFARKEALIVSMSAFNSIQRVMERFFSMLS